MNESRILIVDDDIDLASSLQNMLFLEDYQAHTASDFQSAVELSNEIEPHMALIDIRLGSRSGIELLSDLKTTRPQICCVMMTGYASEDTAIAALQEGAYDFLRKPFKANELLSTINRGFDRIRLEIEKSSIEENLKQRNEDYRKLNLDLEKKVEQRTKELEKLHQELVRQAHQAGMAEISTSVLHNVGNVLTSVITSTQVIRARLDAPAKKQALERGLEKLSELKTRLESEGDIQTLFTFFSRFGILMDKEHDDMNHHVSRIETNIDLIRNVIRSQQKYASAGFQSENCELTELVEDAIAIQSSSWNSLKFQVALDCQQATKLQVPRHKLMHAMVNILKNAWEACDGEGKVSILIYKDDLWAYIKVKDTGCGISPENLRKIFQYGFTTKQDGHGFGLHTTANALSEMGGALWAESDGVNQGATFVIKVPLTNRD